MRLTIGDLVRAKTGGVEMTVGDVNEVDGITCLYFDDLNILHHFMADEDDLAITEKREDSDDFSVGDVVRLRSGGPAMTILEIIADIRYLCALPDGNATTTHLFLPQTLISLGIEDYRDFDLPPHN